MAVSWETQKIIIEVGWGLTAGLRFFEIVEITGSVEETVIS